ncbi:hypothetical protein M9434_000241 [Picochlorum sp. BPE23]|nr:hypothetical protein M9434_000241 [Picochlorum sp. BPE23]KAI8106271.1 hypothetical protein M9435_000817 [Picochlorum sp. BPE23]|mmetsp:Transcript_8929/g.17762  ORF Transcript_8929/g.17762 Transcript_8929/m.17762 type:complete len:122 (-) Transcript_8929:547-912(-)|eukprot:jgi/Picre1/28390/NNA_003795.t1
MSSMPMDGVPRDPLRDGLYAHKDVSRVTHPVENILRESDTSARKSLQEQVYGTALPARAVIEHQILNRIERLPGFPSSKLGLESLTGELDHFGFESYLPSMEEKIDVLKEPHEGMEKKCGL